MTDTVQTPGGLPDAFIGQVKDALEHLHDLAYLQQHPLIQSPALATGSSSMAAAQRLRAAIADAIEALSPRKGMSFRYPHARVYNMLTLHYVDRLTIREAANELGVSTRQADRDLRQGEQGVAALLQDRLARPAPDAPDVSQTSSLQAEIALLSVRMRPTDLLALLRRCQDAVKPLAAERDLRIAVESPAEPLMVSTDPLLAEQILLTVISRALSQAQPGVLRLTLESTGDRATIGLRSFLDPRAANTLIVDAVVTELAEQLRWDVTQRDLEDGVRCVTIQAALSGPLVLVIDDNEGLVSLLQRYLTDQACRVVVATTGAEGLRLAQELHPAAVILDIMMPDMHGWAVLQELRAHRQTAQIPVIICSVINNPDLARALGAAMFLPKPVRQDDILAALARLGIV
jgi:CheY-like chemotaxis protein